MLDRKVCVVKRGLGSNGAITDVEGIEERRLIEIKGTWAFRVRADDKNQRNTSYSSLGQGSQRIGESCAAGGGRDGKPSACAVEGIGGPDSSRFVSDAGVAESRLGKG